MTTMARPEVLKVLLLASGRFQRTCAQRGIVLREAELDALVERLSLTSNDECMQLVCWSVGRVDAPPPTMALWVDERSPFVDYPKVLHLIYVLFGAIAGDPHCSDEVVVAARELRKVARR